MTGRPGARRGRWPSDCHHRHTPGDGSGL